MSLGNTLEFNAAVHNREPETFLTGMFSAAQKTAPISDNNNPKQSFFQALGTKLPDVPKINVQAQQVSTDQVGANAAAGVNLSNTQNVADVAQTAQATMSDAVRHAQEAIALIAAEQDVDTKLAYPNVQMGCGAAVGGDLAMSAIGADAVGAAVTVASTIAEDIKSSAKNSGMTASQMRGMIEDCIQQKAAAANSPTEIAMKADAPKPSLEPTIEQNLACALDARFDTEFIMALDPDNLHQLPEWQEVETTKKKALELSDDLKVARDETAYKAGFSAAQEQALSPVIEEAAGKGMDMKALAGINAGDVLLASEGISGIVSGVMVEPLHAQFNNASNISFTIEQALKTALGPAQDVPPPQVAQAFNAGMGGAMG